MTPHAHKFINAMISGIASWLFYLYHQLSSGDAIQFVTFVGVYCSAMVAVINLLKLAFKKKVEK